MQSNIQSTQVTQVSGGQGYNVAQMFPTQEDISKFNNMVKHIPVAMMTSKAAIGTHLHSRPMQTLGQSWDGKFLYFFTRKDTEKCNEIMKDHEVNVAYVDSSNYTFVSVCGICEFINDKVLEQKFWSPYMKAWFPNGLEDPNLCLMRITVTGIEYWDSGANAMVRLFGHLKAAIKGEVYQPTFAENKKLDMSSNIPSTNIPVPPKSSIV